VVGPAQDFVADGSSFTPKTDSAYTLGTTSVRYSNVFSDLFTAPAATITMTTGNLTGNVTGDVTGNLTGDVTGSVTGNSDTATALATGRTISLTGDVTGTSAAFDGTGNVSFAATVGDDTHNHTLSTVTDAGTIASQNANNVTITGGSISGITEPGS
jgi:hypothetical protein